ncbi:hypothetical protein SELMODRAFT_416971 [Selaginella moellendorffii]|uniref:Uncharacterized protein n=1 Tax=Selaginella moellendorffii TaxID=88036 RepID=D8S0Z0_SELML|nr:hypothetical protein SELMODRAFT_416971 [Selaginella moellendorffii]
MGAMQAEAAGQRALAEALCLKIHAITLALSMGLFISENVQVMLYKIIFVYKSQLGGLTFLVAAFMKSERLCYILCLERKAWLEMGMKSNIMAIAAVLVVLLGVVMQAEAAGQQALLQRGITTSLQTTKDKLKHEGGNPEMLASISTLVPEQARDYLL